ncbi:MAG: hydrogenase expression/formation protein [Gammaproteobacteria bacterium]|jgi:hydrogenase-1 operon protein HyaF
MSKAGMKDLQVEAGVYMTRNVEPLLHEIRHAVTRWLDSGEATSIDLRGIPMAPGEEQRIIDTLGTGEVQASMTALGPSEIVETRFPGVWRVTHYNSENEVIGKFIEICDMPQVLKAQTEDIREGLAQLTAQLA